jgi:signal transduction histidine kinase
VDQNLLEHMLVISRHMAEMRNLEPLLNYVIDEAIKLVGAEKGYIVLTRDDGTFKFMAKRGQDGVDLKNGEDQISTSVLNKVIQTSAPLILRDAINDPAFSEARSVVALGLRSIMCVPLIASGKTIGGIYVENRTVRNRFKENDLPPLTLFANQAAAVAIQNAVINDKLEAVVAERTKELQQRSRELEEAHDQLEKSWTEAVEANRLRTVWLSNLAHDLRAPLNIVTMTLSALEKGSLGELNAEQREWVTKSLTAVQHTKSLIDNLFDIFKIEAGAITLHRTPINLESFLRDIYDVAQGLPWPENVTLQLDLATPLPTLTIDPVRMRQVLINLLTNAQKFTVQGTVKIHARHEAAKQEVVIGIADTGEGIPAHKVGRLFQRFQQVDDDSDRRRLGTGLGLAICREFVEMHGGRIWVESQFGHGANFVFALPVEPER